MKTVLVTGSRGFIGKNLVAHLSENKCIHVLTVHWDDSEERWREQVLQADVIVHLAGVNRPDDIEEFDHGNAVFTKKLCKYAADSTRQPHVIMSSSIQAERDSPYGVSKRAAEEVLQDFSKFHKTRVTLFRLKNVFGKWCRPNYNSVVATFCHNIAHELPVQINDPERELELIHVDDVVGSIVRELNFSGPKDAITFCGNEIPSTQITLGELAERIRDFHHSKETLITPNFNDDFSRQLYSTFLSYVDSSCWEYALEIREDNRGSLAEFMKSESFGQVFVSRTKPGVTRGNHYHHVKTEKFLVLSGEGLIRFRHINSTKILEYSVRGEDYRVVDIPPGYTHSITNIGDAEMVTLFWASEIFNPDQPDTYFQPVDTSQQESQIRVAS
jgi:UDP-2-acetamido-2,6-beta-L-arabino-hexul-4-ose reductase